MDEFYWTGKNSCTYVKKKKKKKAILFSQLNFFLLKIILPRLYFLQKLLYLLAQIQFQNTVTIANLTGFENKIIKSIKCQSM